MTPTRRPPVLAALAVAALLAGRGQAEQIEVDARLEPTLVGVGQLLTFSLEARVERGLDLALEPSFELENLEIVAGPSQSQQVSFVNGRVSRSQTLRWSLRASEVGTARVRSPSLTVNGQVFDLPEQVVEVQSEPVEQLDPYGRSSRLTSSVMS